jgi:hypothetical protein
MRRSIEALETYGWGKACLDGLGFVFFIGVITFAFMVFGA